MVSTSATSSAAAHPLHSIIFGALAERIHMYCVVFHTQSLPTMAGVVEGRWSKLGGRGLWPKVVGFGLWSKVVGRSL